MESSFDIDKQNKPTRTEEWIETRFLLFEKYCFPSIINQSCQNFIWFVFFDTLTPDKYINKIKDYESLFPLFKPLFLEVGDYATIKRVFNAEIQKYLKAEDEYVITSRIDNDDAFHKDYIAKVQKLFDRQQNQFISFIYGLQYDINKEVLVRMHYNNNHFISRIEKITKNVNTVITYDHTYINKVGDVIYIDNKSTPFWLEIIHNGNVMNILYPYALPLFIRRKTKDFHINANPNLSVYNTIVFLMRNRKTIAYDLFKKILKFCQK